MVHQTLKSDDSQQDTVISSAGNTATSFSISRFSLPGNADLNTLVLVELLSQDAHGVQVMQTSILQKTPAQNPFGPKSSTHICGNGPPIVTADLKANALDVKRAKRMGQYRSYGVATKATASNPDEDPQFRPPCTIRKVAERDAANERT